MFLPNRSVQQEKEQRARYYKRVEELTQQRFASQEMNDACCISVQEVVCGDPACSPVDTVVSLTFDSGGQGMFVVPAEAKDLTVEHLRAAMPPTEILEKWFRGEPAEWPPMDDDDDDDDQEIPNLRFAIGTRVECRVGPTQWEAGTVIQWWYREAMWPDNVYAPYKIRLTASGKEIYAPQDDDRLIRLDMNNNNNNATTAVVAPDDDAASSDRPQQRPGN